MDGEKSLAERREEMARAVLPAVIGKLEDWAPEEAVNRTMHVTRRMLETLDRAKAADRAEATFPEVDRRERER